VARTTGGNRLELKILFMSGKVKNPARQTSLQFSQASFFWYWSGDYRSSKCITIGLVTAAAMKCAPMIPACNWKTFALPNNPDQEPYCLFIRLD